MIDRRGRSRATQLVFAALFTGCLLRVWQMLLLRQHMDEPLIVAAWILVTAAIAVATLRPARAGIGFIGLAAVLVFLFHWGFERAASDGREYYVQVRSLVMDHDLDFTNETAVLGARGTAKMYPFGSAILWSPFMLFAHLWLKMLNLFGGTYSLDGYRNPYQRAIGIGTLVYGFAGMLLMWRMLRDYFDELISAISLVAILCGTFLLWYLTVENSMVHAVSLFATMVFLYVWHRWRPGRGDAPSAAPALLWWIALGTAAGVMTMVRWQNLSFAVLAVLLAMWPLRRSPAVAVRGAIVAAAAGFIAFTPQLIFWKVVRGGWFAVPVADHAFDVSALHGLDVLFSSNHGLLSTTPIVYFAILGLPLFFRRDIPLATLLIGGFISQVFINGGNDGWWGGAGFAARRFDSCLFVFAVGLASLIVWLRRRPLVAPVAVIGSLLCVNAFLMLDVRRQTLASAGAITFTDAMSSVYARVGNPFSFPYNAYVAWRYDADWALYDKLRGRTFNNIDIDLGGEGDDMFLGHGWLGQEHNETMTFRWTSGPSAALVVPLKDAAPYRLEVFASPFGYPDAPPQSMAVLVNRQVVARITMQPGANRYEVAIPASALRQNLNSIRFEFGYSKSPQEAGLSNDARSLAVMFDRIRLTRVTGG